MIHDCPTHSTTQHFLQHLPSQSTMSDKYLKMEDVHRAASSASPTPSAPEQTWAQFSTTQSSTQDAIVVHSKPAKKRKSWGQELPEPKTALPPRKRAKTDDEKEQRRIERIKRNRAAAHNSRERKRQEAENLAVHLARANATLDAYRRHFGELPAHIQIPEVRIEVDDSGNEHITTSTPAPSLVESSGSQHDPSSPISPPDDFSFSHIDIKTEADDSVPEAYIPDDFIPLAIGNKKESESFTPDLTPAARPYEFAPLGLTQHSAEMLSSDPQCRPSNANRSMLFRAAGC